MDSKMKKIAAAVIVAIMGALGGGIGSQLANNSDSGTPQSPTSSVSVETTQEQTETVTAAAQTTDAAQKTTKNADDKPTEAEQDYVVYTFRNSELLEQHFSKHGSEFDYATAEEYEKGASDVINSDEALHKTEAEDGDGVYYIEDTNEFVILSTDGYIRTYFKPNDKKAYYDRQ